MNSPFACPPALPAWVETDLNAIAHNLALARSQVGPETLIYPVIKSDAYGHGLVRVARRLAAEGANGCCVARLWEATELRENGVDLPIYLLTSVLPEEAEAAVELDTQIMVFRRDVAEALSARAVAAGRTVSVHIKVDCGMSRLGVLPDDAVAFAEFLRDLPGLETRGLMTHFSNADDEDDDVTREQIGVYEGVARALDERGLLPPVCHLSNSDATMRYSQARRQMVRPGMATYGGYPSEWYRERYELRPAMSLRARLISIKDMPAGRGLSYSHQFTTRRPSRIGVVLVGYADGYLRAQIGKASMIVRGRRVPVVGRICMEQTLLDLTDLEGVEYGDVATVLGADGDERITSEEIGERADTINYEIVTHLGRNFPRFFLDGDEWSTG